MVTEADKPPKVLLEKVTTGYVYIGLGYVCVRNGIGDYLYEEAQGDEANCFKIIHFSLRLINL